MADGKREVERLRHAELLVEVRNLPARILGGELVQVDDLLRPQAEGGAGEKVIEIESPDALRGLFKKTRKNWRTECQELATSKPAAP